MIGKKTFIDLTGEVFGRLTVLHRVPSDGKVKFACKCECGNTVNITASNLRSGTSKSCGCLNTEKRSSTHKTHGKRNSPEYNSWRGMKNRCYNTTHNRYAIYGGRGITVCDRWLNSFENFFADMGAKPHPTYSIDRINVDGNYEPSNCRWASKSEQRLNIRK